MNERVDKAARTVHLGGRDYRLVPDGETVWRVLDAAGQDVGWFSIGPGDIGGAYRITTQEDRNRKQAEGEVVRAVAFVWVAAFAPGEDPRPVARRSA
jgi:hypothetical protein